MVVAVPPRCRPTTGGLELQATNWWLSMLLVNEHCWLHLTTWSNNSWLWVSGHVTDCKPLQQLSPASQHSAVSTPWWSAPYVHTITVVLLNSNWAKLRAQSEARLKSKKSNQPKYTSVMVDFKFATYIGSSIYAPIWYAPVQVILRHLCSTGTFKEIVQFRRYRLRSYGLPLWGMHKRKLLQALHKKKIK